MTLLRVQVEANPCQTIKELSNALITNLGRPSKNICNRLVKQTEQVFGFCIICLKKTELTDLRHATYCFNGTIQNSFDRLITANEKLVLYVNPKRKRQWLSLKELLSQVYIQKRRFCVFGGVFVESSILKCLNLEKLLMQTFIVNN
ncbi:HTH_48 domain-containing protein [Trichonephila clavipes]|nr:HTH_48 domain-containing protein [Trichonephila clavipes]